MSNVGVVIDLAVHDIDLIRWFTESDIVEVQPQLSSAVAEREDIALLQFRTASGVLAHINTNWLTPFKARNVTVATRGKYVMGDLLTRQVTECFGFKPDGSYSMRHLPVGHDEPLRAELIAFLDAVRAGGVPAVTGDEGVASLEIAIRCLETPARPAAHPPRARGRAASSADLTSGLFESIHEPAYAAQNPCPSSISARSAAGSASRIDDAVARVLDALPVHQRPGSDARWKRPLAAFCGAKHVVSCASGTDALLMVLMAKDVGRGRRRDLPVLHVLRDRRGGGADRRDAGVRRCRRGDLQHRRRHRSKRGIATARKRGPQAEGGDPGRSVRPARRL